MASLIGHYYDGRNPGTFSLFEIVGLDETDKQYKRTTLSIETPRADKQYGVHEHWVILPKRDLGELRYLGSGRYSMFAVEADMPRFKKLVITSLEKKVTYEKESYDRMMDILNAARTAETKGNEVSDNEILHSQQIRER